MRDVNLKKREDAKIKEYEKDCNEKKYKGDMTLKYSHVFVSKYSCMCL